MCLVVWSCVLLLLKMRCALCAVWELYVGMIAQRHTGIIPPTCVSECLCVCQEVAFSVGIGFGVSACMIPLDLASAAWLA